MIFYEIVIDSSTVRIHREGKVYLLSEIGRQDTRHYVSNLFETVLEKYDNFMNPLLFVFPGEVNKYELHVGIAYDPNAYTIKKCLAELRNVLGRIKILKETEVNSRVLRQILGICNKNYILSTYNIESELKLDLDPDNRLSIYDDSFEYKEEICSDKYIKIKECISRANEILPSKSLLDELNRIYSHNNKREFYGHPVHYLINAKDYGAADDIIDILISALYGTKRLLSRRVTKISNLKSASFSSCEFNKAIELAQDGTIVLYMDIEPSDGRYSKSQGKMIEVLQEKIDKFGENTLFVFVDISGKTGISNDNMEILQSKTDIIQITEGYGNRKEAHEYLERLIQKSKYKGCDISTIDPYFPDGDYFTVSDIYKIYRKWYDRGLRNIVYKAYKDDTIQAIRIDEYKNEPYEELQNLIGLTNVKEVIDDIIALAKINRLRSDMALTNKSASMHMVFTGNPGTAKTTVARLVGRILKEEEVLTSGHMVECGRQDLVGRYVGWTAKTVEEKFKAARGGVLFIDEAYSLVDDSNSYGAEAINTIVQLMENYRENLVVIFAGYPDKMKLFLNQNEGMNSRITFHLSFPDYSESELLEILYLMVDQYGYKLSDSAKHKAGRIIAQELRSDNFGNGRYVRNLLEQATMHQARRLMTNKTKKITKKDAMLLLPEDICAVSRADDSRQLSKIGFMAG